MEQLVAELKKRMPFKESTSVGDIVLIAAKEPQMLVYAVVGGIVRDDSRAKAEWWHVTLHILTMPPQTVTWILRTPQLTGQEIFTMGGEGRFIKAVHLGDHASVPPPADPPKPNENGKGKKTSLRIVK